MEPLTHERACHLFAALSHPGRLRITELLTRSEEGMTVGAIASTLGFSQSGTSQHLAYLARVGVLTVVPRGTSRLYRVRGPRIERILTLIEEFCEVHSLYGGVSAESEEASESTLPPAPKLAAPSEVSSR